MIVSYKNEIFSNPYFLCDHVTPAILMIEKNASMLMELWLQILQLRWFF